MDEGTGEPTGMTITLPDWLYDGIVNRGGVLTIHEDYFLLTGGIERWLYRVARKHAGSQETGWSFTMRQLFEKSGSTARLSDFACDIREAVESDWLPEYSMAIHRTRRMTRSSRSSAAASLRSPIPGTTSPAFRVAALPAAFHQKPLNSVM